MAATLLAAGQRALEGLANKVIVTRVVADGHTLGKWPRRAENVTEVTARTLEETPPRQRDARSTIHRIRHTGSYAARRRLGCHLTRCLSRRCRTVQASISTRPSALRRWKEPIPGG